MLWKCVSVLAALVIMIVDIKVVISHIFDELRIHTPDDALLKGLRMVARALWRSEARRVCALVGDPARAVGECRDVAKAQP